MAQENYAVPGAGSGGGALPGFDEFYLDQDPVAAWMAYLRNAGLMDTRPVSGYARGQQSRIYGLYQAVAGADPELSFWDYLQKHQPDLQADFLSQSPSQRGDFTSRTLTPRARFVNAY